MINGCENCGEYRVDKRIIADEQVAICPVCQHPNHFIQSPLFFVCGASGTGKSTICRMMMQKFHQTINLDGDILLHEALLTQDNNCNHFYNIWMRLGKNIAQSGRSVVIFNAGAIPENIEACEERPYFSQVHYLALVCDDDELVKRLKQRPVWRNSHHDTFIKEQLRFNSWLKNKLLSEAQFTLLDTTKISIEATYDRVTDWVQNKL